jgi:hypothetical protein
MHAYKTEPANWNNWYLTLSQLQNFSEDDPLPAATSRQNNHILKKQTTIAQILHMWLLHTSRELKSYLSAVGVATGYGQDG